MGDKILIGPIQKGLRTDVTPFNIDNDSFPFLRNAYQWRDRVKRKRGTAFLTRLNKSTLTVSLGTTTGGGAFSGNIFSILGITEPNASVFPGSVRITIGAQVFTDNSEGDLSNGGSGTGDIKYSTSEINLQTAPILATTSITISLKYYPTLPVMGLEDLSLDPTDNIGTIAFDTKYAYSILPQSPYRSFSVSYYKNPPSSGSYVQKSAWTPLNWNGQDYQQFFTTNYQGALWAVNGTTSPFTTTNIGMQFKRITVATVISGTDVDFTTSNNHPFVAGDFVFINEVNSITGLNFQTGFVLAAPAPTATTFRARFPNATIAAGPANTGIVQALTTSCDPDVSSTTPGSTKDCVRWYDGSPVSSASPPVFTAGSGWVNFMPPLSNASFSISDLPAAQYYLAGARMVVPFKDRLLFIGPVIQTSSGSPIYLQDAVVYSQVGTPYYTASFAGSPLPTTSYTSLLVPTSQSGRPVSFWEDQTGLGGSVAAGFQSEINTVSENEDILIMGFGNRQAQFVYTGNDILPFQFYVINSELGSGATFSTVNLDRGVMTIGTRGFIITSQIESKRFDLSIPDQVFQIKLTGNGAKRICAARDFVNEWIYFTYANPQNKYRFPTQTAQYNYRDNTWALFDESYTTYGLFRKVTGYTWSNIGSVYPTWSAWNDPWNSGSSTLLQPEVIAGNAQGFVVTRADGTGESKSLAIKDITPSTVGGKTTITITSPDHCLNSGDYIVIYDVIGTGGLDTALNGNVFSVSPTITADTFVLNPQIASGTYTYSGLGTIKRMYVPQIQTKQFPVAWGTSRKTRLGTQMYLLTNTANSQVTLLIYLSQDGADPYNTQPSGSLVYSTILYTCPESTNLGLTPANTNLQMLVYPGASAGSGGSSPSDQIWHRVNTSLIGDTVQVKITLSDEQMRDENLRYQFSEIELHSIILDVSPSSLLA